MPGTSYNDSETALTVNGKRYNLGSDNDGVIITAGGEGVDYIAGLSSNASLTVGAAGVYNVNGENLNAKIGDIIIGDAEGSAYIYDPNYINFDNTNIEEILDELFANVKGEGKIKPDYTHALINQLVGLVDTVVNLDTDDDTESSDGLNVVNFFDLKRQNLKVSFVVDDPATSNNGGTTAENPAENVIELPSSNNICVVGTVLTPTTIELGEGQDTIITAIKSKSDGNLKNPSVTVNLNDAVNTLIVPVSGLVELKNYDASRNQSILILDDASTSQPPDVTEFNMLTRLDLDNTKKYIILESITTGKLMLENNVITMNNGAQVVLKNDSSSSDTPSADGESDSGSQIVSLINSDGEMTKVGYTYTGGGDVDLSDCKDDAVLVGNYKGTENLTAPNVSDTSETPKIPRSVIFKSAYVEYGGQAKSGSKKLQGGSGNNVFLAGSGDNVYLGTGQK